MYVLQQLMQYAHVHIASKAQKTRDLGTYITPQADNCAFLSTVIMCVE